MMTPFALINAICHGIHTSSDFGVYYAISDYRFSSETNLQGVSVGQDDLGENTQWSDTIDTLTVVWRQKVSYKNLEHSILIQRPTPRSWLLVQNILMLACAMWTWMYFTCRMCACILNGTASIFVLFIPVNTLGCGTAPVYYTSILGTWFCFLTCVAWCEN